MGTPLWADFRTLRPRSSSSAASLAGPVESSIRIHDEDSRPHRKVCEPASRDDLALNYCVALLPLNVIFSTFHSEHEPLMRTLSETACSSWMMHPVWPWPIPI
jgi:hypothetical protein